MIALVATLLLPLLACARSHPLALNSPLRSQYHAQDELGQYNYGYSGGPSAKHEARTADGVVRGSYAYVDPNGMVQSRSYIADDENGFRVIASDLPLAPAPMPSGWLPASSDPHWVSRWSLQQSPSLASLPSAPYSRHFFAAPSASVGADILLRGSTGPIAPQVTALAPGFRANPFGIRSQYHAQDEAGQYSYGYSNENSSKSETKTLDGVTRGSYSYLDPTGRLQSRSYVADADGFRVAASDLPSSSSR